MGKKKKKSTEFDIEKLLDSSNKKIRLAKMEKKRIQCNCQHKGKNGKTWLHEYRTQDEIDNDLPATKYKCKRCKRVIDGSMFDDDYAKKIRTTCNNMVNLCDLLKVNSSKYLDEKYMKSISDLQYKIWQLRKVAEYTIKKALNEDEEVGGKKKKNKKSGLRISGGGSSIF